MVVLGSTGSIGTNALSLCQKHNIKVEALSCGTNIKLLNDQISKFKPKFVCIKDKSLASKVCHDRIFSGEDGLVKMLDECQSKKILNSIVGFAGLAVSFKTQELGKTLALANKESLVVGGKFLDSSKILPIDSEHFGLKFLMDSKTKIKKMVITASGGAFYNTSVDCLKDVGPADALKHPNWSMGAKITIDSATMANKLFEVMEAYWLYGIEKIDAVIEPTSMVHALIEFVDGSTTAHISGTDMALAIAHAILDRVEENIVNGVDLLSLGSINFFPIPKEKYPIFFLKNELLKNPDLGVVVNSANEFCVGEFLGQRCGFLDISRVVLSIVEKFSGIKISDKNDLFLVDKEIKKYSKEIMYAKI